MIKFAHVGFPKCASTWLQSEVFSKHSDIFFLGRKPGDTIISDEIRTLFWNTFLDVREFAYDRNKTQTLLKPYLDAAEKENKESVGISLEQLLHPHIGRLEFSERSRRLYDFMGQNTKIIIVVREQSAWIKSYYSNLVSEAGLRECFEEFKTYFFAEPDVSPMSTLFYDRVFEVYATLFGAKNIKVIPMEMMSESVYQFADSILEFIGVGSLNNLSDRKKNESASDINFATQLYLNNLDGYRLGRSNAVYKAFGWQSRSVYESNKTTELPQQYKEDQKHYMRSWNVDNFVKKHPDISNNL